MGLQKAFSFCFCYYNTHFTRGCVPELQGWPLFALTPQQRHSRHYWRLHFRWREVSPGTPSSGKPRPSPSPTSPREHLKEELGSVAWMATILADQVPEFHFDLCWAGSSTGQEPNRGREPGFAISVPRLAKLLEAAHGCQHKRNQVASLLAKYSVGSNFWVVDWLLVYWLDAPAEDPKALVKQADNHISQGKNICMLGRDTLNVMKIAYYFLTVA